MRTFIISPFRGEVERNLRYAKRALLDSINRGEAPFAPHLLFPQVLDEHIELYRLLGMSLGKKWIDGAEQVVVYADYGISEGMIEEMNYWLLLEQASDRIPFIEVRCIGREPDEQKLEGSPILEAPQEEAAGRVAEHPKGSPS